jgi:hypothetical protein
MQTIKAKPKIDSVSKARIWATGQQIEQKNRHNDSLKSCGFLKEFKTANFEIHSSKMIFSTLPEPASLSAPNIRFSNTCKVEEQGLNLLRNKNTGCSSRILNEKHSKKIPSWITESCFCLLALENRN